MNILDSLRELTRIQIKKVAKQVDKLSGGHITANQVTVVGVLMHIPIAMLIAVGSHGWAALLLVIFGLFDTLDGELARLQKRASNAGMLLDASTDRIKEVMLYSGIASYFIASAATAYLAVWAVIACGASLTVSYVKAKGETAVASKNLPASEVNRLFQDGLARFEVRMGLLVLGLLAGWLSHVLILIALLSSYTALQRLVNISRKIS
jgi:phosphatidylglycerophosphate synthase